MSEAYAILLIVFGFLLGCYSSFQWAYRKGFEEAKEQYEPLMLELEEDADEDVNA